ncbi:hypothetical protein D9619_005238 [Psilocybe cf. subviscida]|uniref:Uncharacterized protein n=1 Tax=Psilocybe cf. subviscida TaxID=2480587 RepID=A0A8H5BXW7_9AGAR|nr:hypothetical protein D9619_005238 [Psilocybe cf. subviscida]
MGPMHWGFVMAIFAWHYVSPAVALISNRTIDDALGDSVTGQKVVFLPSTQGVWSNQDCIGCALNPDTTKAFDSTYTAATYNSGLGSISATLKFQGTAIYVFFILANSAPPGITTLTAVNFTLDEQPPVSKLHAPSVLTSDFEFNAMLWSQTGLPATQHTLVVSTSGVDNDVYVNFDYAIYTHDDEVVTPPATSSSPTTSGTAPSVVASSLPVSSNPFHPGVPTAASSIRGPASATNSSMVTLPALPNSVSPIPTTFLTTTNSIFPSTLKSESGDAVSSSHRGAIAGGAAGGAFLLLAFILAMLYLCRRHRQRNNRQLLIARPITSNTQNGSEHLQDPSSITPFPNVSHSMLRNAASIPDHSGVYLSEKSGRARRAFRQSPPLLSYVGTNDSSAAMSSPHTDDLRRARQEELNHQLTARQEAIRELSSDLDSITKGHDYDISRQHVRRVSGVTLHRLRSLAGRDAQQREGGDNGHVVTVGDLGARGAEGPTEVNMIELQELNRLLRLEIESLKLQQQSAWAQGLSDDPPPGYTPPMRNQQT